MSFSCPTWCQPFLRPLSPDSLHRVAPPSDLPGPRMFFQLCPVERGGGCRPGPWEAPSFPGDVKQRSHEFRLCDLAWKKTVVTGHLWAFLCPLSDLSAPDGDPARKAQSPFHFTREEVRAEMGEVAGPRSHS